MSCPNVESGCISIGTDAGETRALVERCRAETDVPVLAKLSPSVADVAAIATAAAEGGAHGLVLINTVRGIAIDRDRLRPLLGGGGGGLSGPAIKPVALHAIFHARAATGLPIIGMGGVASAQDCVEFLAAGASLVGIGTSLFADPGLPERLLPELGQLMRRHGADGDRRFGRRRPPAGIKLNSSLSVSGREFPLFIGFSRGCTPPSHGYNRPLP